MAATHSMHAFRRLQYMEPAMRKALLTMGNTTYNACLRDVAQGMYRLRSCVVYSIGNTPVGWVAYYDSSADATDRECSVWVAPSHRCKGIGTTLIKEAYRRWRRYNPSTFLYTTEVWDSMDRNKS